MSTTMHYRIAKPNEFTFKRDSDGRETIEHQGVIVRINTSDRVTAYVGGYVDLSAADELARTAGFWRMGRPRPSCPTIGVTVEVAP